MLQTFRIFLATSIVLGVVLSPIVGLSASRSGATASPTMLLIGSAVAPR